MLFVLSLGNILVELCTWLNAVLWTVSFVCRAGGSCLTLGRGSSTRQVTVVRRPMEAPYWFSKHTPIGRRMTSTSPTSYPLSVTCGSKFLNYSTLGRRGQARLQPSSFKGPISHVT